MRKLLGYTTFAILSSNTAPLIAATAVAAEPDPSVAIPVAPPPSATPIAAPAPTETPKRNVSLTLSPLHLIAPIVELTGEIRLHDKFGIAFFGGYGSMKFESTSGGTTQTTRFKAYEAGTSIRYYPVGSFEHGMQLGAEALYAKVVTDDAGSSQYSVKGRGDGLAIGPFVGYKIITRAGFTFDSQLGFQYIAARGSASSGSQTSENEDSDIIPLLNLNVGWSF